MSTSGRKDFILYKILLAGESGVGKTTLLGQYADGRFDNNSKATVGIDFKIRNLNIKDENVKIQIWDTAGQDKFRTVCQAYYKGANVIVVLYAIDNRESFEQLTKWLSEARAYARSDIPVMIVGTKCENESHRQVAAKEAQKLADENKVHFLGEVSAKNNVGVQTLFEQILDKVPPLGLKKTSKHEIERHVREDAKMKSARDKSAKRQFFKVIVVGEAQTSKTSIIQQYKYNKCNDSQVSTIGADFVSKELSLNERDVTLQLWDTAGAERFKGLGTAFYRGSDAVVITYSITDEKSFKSVLDAKNAVLKELGKDSTAPIYLVGTKLDVVQADSQARRVSEAEAREFAKKNNMHFFGEVSAKADIGIHDDEKSKKLGLFGRVVADLLKVDLENKSNQKDLDKLVEASELLSAPPSGQHTLADYIPEIATGATTFALGGTFIGLAVAFWLPLLALGPIGLAALAVVAVAFIAASALIVYSESKPKPAADGGKSSDLSMTSTATSLHGRGFDYSIGASVRGDSVRPDDGVPSMDEGGEEAWKDVEARNQLNLPGSSVASQNPASRPRLTASYIDE